MKRKSYSPEFKAKVTFEAAKCTMTSNKLASKYEVHPVQISQWEKELLENRRPLQNAQAKDRKLDRLVHGSDESLAYNPH